MIQWHHMNPYDHRDIEKKWQTKWEEQNLYAVSDHVPGKENYYTLVEFSYPSGNLHVGHWYAFSVPDIFARFKRMQGFNVLYPTGFDAFGLPAENAAIKLGADPKVLTYEQMDRMRAQIKSMGAMFDWNREVVTCDPEYYKWTQWMFNQFLKNDLAYRAVTKVNWCPKDQTVLANEQVTDGKCERCGTEVVQKDQEQWMLRITKYADRLIDDLDTLQWPHAIKESQKNWIGRSEGSEVEFPLVSNNKKEYFKFRTNLTHEILRGERWVTFRAEEKHVSVGDRVDLIDWKDGDESKQNIFSQAVIKKIVVEKLKNIPLNYPGHGDEGTQEDRLARFKKYYGEHITDDSEIYIYEFDLLKVKVFTTRADTLFGVTYVVLAPEHPLVAGLLDQAENADEVRVYVNETKKKSELDRQQSKEKTGVEIKGVKAINPANGEEVPVWVADYVLAGYGTGAVMAVPAHDERDFEFAKKYNLSIKKVIYVNLNSEDLHSRLPHVGKSIEPREVVLEYDWYGGAGELVHSGEFTGMSTETARKKITEFVGGKLVSTYRLRDWGISRQRYWGCPIPIVYDPEGVAHPIPDEHLPWILPTDVDHTPDGTAPLARSKELLERTEKIFGKGWRPEVETMDTFVDSSWYFYRYLDHKNNQTFAAQEKRDAWMPIDLYMGGAEHTTMHLLYSRFWVKVLHDLGFVQESEAYTMRRNRGLILGPDGNKMSKSKGNVIDPDEIVTRLGADTVRLYLAFMGPYGVTTNYPWDPNGVVGVRRFLERVWKLAEKVKTASGEIRDTSLIHQTIKGITDDMVEYKFNTAISKMMILMNVWEKESISLGDYKILLRLLAPFAPHIAEELWMELGETESIHLASWPTFDPSKIDDQSVTLGIQVNGKVRADITIDRDLDEHSVRDLVLAIPEIQKWIDGKEIKKFIYLKGRIISLVV